jgi:anionic cell wall polymer biosynthesis LytR-Cps2A-Psr (LCP) family protein
MEALQFLRTRHGVGDESDLARIGNQQQYMSRLIRKIRSEEVLANPAALYDLADAAVKNITPSESLANPLRMVQLALAVKSVPLEDITFVQYPVLTDPANADHVVPDDDAAAALWAALEQNKPIELSGKAGSNGGVVDVTPTAPPSDGGAPSDTPGPGEVTPAPSTTPGDDTIVLPENINGSNAGQETCSADNR